MAVAEYATNEAIRMKAGFEGATNLADKYVTAAKEAAQSEIDAACSNLYKVPFNPAPKKIKTLTIKLAAYTLRYDAYGDVASQKALEALRKQLLLIAEGEVSIVDDSGADLSVGEGVGGYFGDAPRMFGVEQKF